MRKPLLLLAALLASAGLGMTLTDVSAMQADERGAWGALATWATDDNQAPHDNERLLTRTHLAAGQTALFDFCVSDADFAAWPGRQVRVYFLSPTGEQELAREVDIASIADHARRDERNFCLTALHWNEVLIEGDYALSVRRGESDPPSSAEAIRGRISAWRAPSFGHNGAILLLAGLLLGLLVSLWPSPHSIQQRTKDNDDDGDAVAIADQSKKNQSSIPIEVISPRRDATLWLRVLGPLALLALFTFIGGALATSATMVLAIATTFAILEVVIAFAVVPRALLQGLPQSRGHALDLRPIGQAAWPFTKRLTRFVPAAILLTALGVALQIGGGLLARLVPSTGISPLELFVAAPSASLAVTAVSLLAPIAEELLFRGLVFGSLKRRYGPALALLLSTALFVVFHLPQQWGAWGAVLSLTVSGLAFGLVRQVTGSTWASALVHLAHNASIALMTLG